MNAPLQPDTRIKPPLHELLLGSLAPEPEHDPGPEARWLLRCRAHGGSDPVAALTAWLQAPPSAASPLLALVSQLRLGVAQLWRRNRHDDRPRACVAAGTAAERTPERGAGVHPRRNPGRAGRTVPAARRQGPSLRGAEARRPGPAACRDRAQRSTATGARAAESGADLARYRHQRAQPRRALEHLSRRGHPSGAGARQWRSARGAQHASARSPHRLRGAGARRRPACGVRAGQSSRRLRRLGLAHRQHAGRVCRARPRRDTRSERPPRIRRPAAGGDRPRRGRACRWRRSRQLDAGDPIGRRARRIVAAAHRRSAARAHAGRTTPLRQLPHPQAGARRPPSGAACRRRPAVGRARAPSEPRGGRGCARHARAAAAGDHRR